MSALCLGVALRLLFIGSIFVSTILCSNVVWKNRGESITFQCRFEKESANSLSLKKGLKKDKDIFYKYKKSEKVKYAEVTRTEIHDKFPNFDILLKNLTKNDTGVYWCMYNVIIDMQLTDVEGQGSVLLIVTEKVSGSTEDSPKGRSSDLIAEADKSTAAGERCSQPNHDLFVTSVVISAVVLSVIFIAVLLLVIRKVKYLRKTKPSPVPLNDVYEDMRGTIRR